MGVNHSIGIAKPSPDSKRIADKPFPAGCQYTKRPTVIKSTGCGNAICYGLIECVSQSGSIISEIPISCVAKAKWTAQFGTSGFYYECPNPTTCYTMNALASKNTIKEEIIHISSAINWHYDKSGKVVEGEVPIKELFPSGGSFFATPPPSKREKPKNPGGTQ